MRHHLRWQGKNARLERSMKPFQGLGMTGGPVTQGALRDPGLCYPTPSAL